MEIKKSCYLFLLFTIMFFTHCKKTNNNETRNLENQIVENIKQKTKQQILVCAHRAFHTFAPENSIQSITNAIGAKIDFVEIDVRTTKDSMLVLMHDKSIDRTTTGKGLVKDFTYKELQQFNLKIGDSVTQQKIPLVKNALKLSKGKIIPNLDLKAVKYMQLYTMLKSLGMQHQVISFIGKKEKISKMIDIDSLYAVLPLVKTKEQIIFYQKNTKSPLQHFTDESFTKENMQWIHNKGELVFVNTLWDEDKSFIKGNTQAMDSVISLKPAIIQTDHPKHLVDYLRSKKLHD